MTLIKFIQHHLLEWMRNSPTHIETCKNIVIWLQTKKNKIEYESGKLYVKGWLKEKYQMSFQEIKSENKRNDSQPNLCQYKWKYLVDKADVYVDEKLIFDLTF